MNRKVSLLAPFFIMTLSASASMATPQLADQTLLVLLKPHTNRDKAKSDLAAEAQLTTIEDLYVAKDDYSVLHLKPQNAENSVSKVKAMMRSHPEIASVTQNYVYHRLFERHHAPTPKPTPKPTPTPTPTASTPDDPEFSQQWPLTAMRWTAAYSKYGSAQVNPAYLTILSSGVTPVSTGHELGAYVTQYNATTSNVVQEPVKGYTAEGDIDASITGCLTNNQVLLAGSGCFVPSKPLYITMLRITSSDSVSTATIYSALTFAINNQALRHAPGPVSLSYGTSYPDAPLWSDSGIQSLAGSLLNQGDILVVAAGDTPGTYTNYPPGNVVVAQGTNINNQFDSSQLTLVANDPVGAPGAQQPAVINGEYSDNYYGSSFSAPLWASAISMLISVSPSLTSAQAHQILLNTGTNIKGSSWPAVVPAFDAGIQSATSQ